MITLKKHFHSILGMFQLFFVCFHVDTEYYSLIIFLWEYIGTFTGRQNFLLEKVLPATGFKFFKCIE
jgi:hypothetical protein